MARVRNFRSKPDSTNRRDSRSSNCGWLGGLASCMSSTGCTIPRPINRHHVRFTMARAKKGFSGAVIHSASAARFVALLADNACPPRNVGERSINPSGVPASCRAARVSPGSSTTPRSYTCFARFGVWIWVKNAAIPQNSSCFHFTKGWSWHWVQFRRIPRK